MADGTAEHLAFVGVPGRLADEPARIADALGADEDPFRVHAVENVAEPAPFLADQAVGGNPQAVEEHFGGRMVEHGADGFDGQAAAQRVPDIDQEDGQSLVTASVAFPGARPGKQQHEIGMLGPRGPDLLAVDDVAVAVPAGRGPDTGGIAAAGRFRHPEGLQPDVAAGDGRQVLLLLFGRTVAKDGAHDVHLRMTRRGVAARKMHFLENGRGGPEPQAAALEFLGDQRREEAGPGHGADELLRVRPVPVDPLPVAAAEFPAQRLYRMPDVAEVL